MGALVRHLRPGTGLPSAVTLPEHIWNTGGFTWPGQDGGYLGRSASPWLIHCDPSSNDFSVPEVTLPAELPPLRLNERQSLVTNLDRHLESLDRDPVAARLGNHRVQALELLRSPAARRAFNLDEEPPKVRDRYGRNRFGQSVLLARRLVEAGVTLVQVNWTRAKDDGDANPMWDTHTHNAERMKTALMPPTDLAFSALLEDLSQRGLLDETLVVWAAEFGRSPRINAAAGRDHWGHVFSLALAGGGVRGGAVHGASDPLGAYPKDGTVQPHDLQATIFHLLGHDPDTEIHDQLGRPLPLSRGTVIRQVL
jgi:hypothetical protein